MRYFRRTRLLHLAVIPFLLVACDSDVTGPTTSFAPTAASVTATPNLAICHKTEGTKGFVLTRVAAASLAAHVAHGDGAVDDLVPGLPGMVFDDSCTPIASRLSFSFADPVGDHLQLTPVRQFNPPAGIIDVVGLDFMFDNLTGDYEIILTASAATPFVGGFKTAITLFNPDTGATTQDPSFFWVLNEFFLTTPTPVVTLTGTNSRLLAWEAGDRVASCQGAGFFEFGPCLGGLGLPDGISGFSTSVFTFTSEPPHTSPPKGLDVFNTAPAATIGY